MKHIINLLSLLLLSVLLFVSCSSDVSDEHQYLFNTKTKELKCSDCGETLNGSYVCRAVDYDGNGVLLLTSIKKNAKSNIEVKSTKNEIFVLFSEKSDNWVVDAPNSEVFFAGEANSVEIKAVKNASAHFFGSIKEATLIQGHYVVEQGSLIEKINYVGGTLLINKETEVLDVIVDNAQLKIEMETVNNTCIPAVYYNNQEQNLSSFIELKNSSETVPSSTSVAKIGDVYYSSLADVYDFIASQESGIVKVEILRDVSNDGKFGGEIKNIELTIEGNNHKITNSHQYAAGEESDNLSGIRFGSEDYENYRPKVTINNLSVESQYEAFYANDTIDITLNNCKGITNFTQGDSFPSLKNYKESVLAASFSAKLVVNCGEFTSSNYGASIYSTGGEIDLNDCKVKASCLVYANSPRSTDSVSNSTVKISGGEYEGSFYVDSLAGYLTFIAELLIDGGSFDNDPSGYVISGNHAVKTSSAPDKWIVQKD